MRPSGYSAFFIALILLILQGVSVLQAQKNQEPPAMSPVVPKLLQESEALDESWKDVKTDFQKKTEGLIRRLQEEIHSQKMMLDHGDIKRRDGLNENIADLERERDNLKQILAEQKAAAIVDWSKLSEDVANRIRDLRD
jgi:hypothetical protein